MKAETTRMEGKDEINESGIILDLQNSENYEEFQKKLDMYEGWLQFLGSIIVQRKGWAKERDEFNTNSDWGIKL